MRNILRSVVPVLLAAWAAPLPAQSAQPLSVQGSLLYNALFGTAFEGIDDGYGAELQARYTPGVLSIGGGLQFTRHQFADTTGLEGFDIDIWGVFVEPRFVINTGSNAFAPYLSLRIAASWLEMSGEIQGEPVDANTEGTTFNGGGGVLFRVGPRVNLDVGATYGRTDWGDFEIEGENAGDLDPGENLIVRVGVAVGIGG